MSATNEATVQLTQNRIDTVNSAAYEIELMAKAMRKVIESEDLCNEINPVARGILARVVALTSAICQALDPDFEDQKFVANTVYVSDVNALVGRS